MGLSLLVAACAGTDGRQVSLRGKTLALAPLDTAQIKVAAVDDVVEGLPDDGGSLSAPRILSQDFFPRFRRQLERRIAKAGLRLDTVNADTSSAVPATPDYVLQVRSLDVHRSEGEMLVPKIGTVPTAPLYFFGGWTLRDAQAKAVSEGRFQCVVTTHRRATEAEWRKAYDEAARQVIANTPFRR